ncbi:MAG: helix-turn-helix transcriptional regulator [Calditrichaceae bacterium]|nr:helix-turn-helix transcriptional regulator [Calditrichaceae bacterium]MBN2710016.1 helix-turn-helix transcriptional regulator [Calditrichaceae bacterium]RQV93680.1 MAG: XRE family transcriptional regulator [Calditrichota bacterium]
MKDFLTIGLPLPKCLEKHKKTIKEIIGYNIKKHRIKNKYTANEFCSLTGISLEELKNIENGNCNIPAHWLYAFSIIFDENINVFFKF